MEVYCFIWVCTNLLGEFKCGCKMTLLGEFHFISGSLQFSVDYEYYYSCTCVWEQVGAVATTIISTTTTTTFTTATTTTTTTTSTTTNPTLNIGNNSTVTNSATIKHLRRALLYVVQTSFRGSICFRCNIDEYPVRSFTYRTEHVKA
jgi:hypothetical protein